MGKHPLHLYLLGAPNGQTITLEELLAIGDTGAEYGAWLIKIGEGDQFSSGFIEINPNSKIPAWWTARATRRSGPSNPARS